ncbi:MULTISPECIES: serine hydrolase domain-containing protein [unclassified Undibacterium]|uniref:serine hydrolase domain-containing protein n=1 Tax=unclassified Undibacterium TaxID=2630295 RepID=UPI002AC91B64|nr:MULTISPECIES: serine hydrolase domain-containing protein [unclassified Undibacterium]MEB0138417.1 serine hydrolase domain-containing protein [Undibacterium sp. CCC2.1]MEB0171292.1 serine hydrolase domain-containing protein [Undibacterium sp. CCC1.1]MEB0214046.1 serine hydrolase domain-containing protein [Undibacterium sp. 5I2]WPX43661.1 serine hydrolase domain-containing protein [Undibacterium sp. CCC3.4]
MSRFQAALRCILLLATFCCSAARAAAPVTTPLDAAAQALFQSGFQGAVLAARGERILHQSASKNFGPLTRSFRFASITKQMTAIMLMQEVEAGHLQLDAPLSTWWPDYPNVAARAITLRQFMMHYSGLANDNADPGFHMQNAGNGDDMQKFATGLCAAPLKSVPGSSFDYNNCDYLVLGALLERVTGQSFTDLLTQRIFQVAGMRHAGLYSAAHVDDASHLHGILDGKPEPAVNFASYAAAGGSYGTLQDLLAFDRAFLNGKLLSSSARTVMTTPNAVGGALGVWVYPFRAANAEQPSVIVERQGWIAGVRILNLIDLQSGNILILVSADGDLDLSQTWAEHGPAAPLLKALLLSK